MSAAGNLPRDLGRLHLDASEMMFWMYCPVSLPGESSFTLPGNLRAFEPMLEAVAKLEPELFAEKYVYLTAKTLWASPSCVGNRPGWHIDGYGTEDINYIWSSRAPTQFLQATPLAMLSEDCDLSMAQMGHLASSHAIIEFPNEHLLRLDNTVIHRSPVSFEPGIRSFAKVSISDARYNLIGNSRNHELAGSRWPLVERRSERNHPSQEPNQ